MSKGGALHSSGDYAIIDVTQASISNGKILMLIEDKETADEIAATLRHRGCDVSVQQVAARTDTLMVSMIPQVAT
jgi:hypothetical protein